jgi:hypothetical protein
LLVPAASRAQHGADWKLDKMPADLETELALSSLPPHLRSGATVYLLDPEKGYYAVHQGTNGFVCFIDRTDWEWGKYRKDVFAPMSYDPEGARTIFPVFRDVAAMRASGKLTALQVRDTVISRYHRGIYKAPAREGLSYMLAPIMRVYTTKPGDETVMTMSMPHYMFYASYVTGAEMGINNDSPRGPWWINAGDAVMGNGKGPVGFVVMAAGDAETAKIAKDGRGLLARLAAYSPYFKVDGMTMK